ncbi:MAG: sulfatase [Candidatus Levyibacteriota bacterium]
MHATDEKTFGGFENSSTHALDWLQANKDKKFFMFIHGYDAHGQFNLPQNEKLFVPKDYNGSFTGSPQEEAVLREQQLSQKISLTPADVSFWNGLYDSKIREGDDSFSKFWDEVKKMGLDKNTVVIVLSDHGEEIYEHSGIDHGQSLYDELVHVPLVFEIPGFPGGKKINQQVTSLDVAPTLFALLGLTPDKQYQSQMRGINLLPIMQGQEFNGQDVFTETDYRNFTHKRAIQTADGWKYILTMETGKAELYNLKSDPGEKNNLVDKDSKTAFQLDQRLKDHIKAMGDNPYKTWTVGCLPVYVGECVQ